MKSIVFTLFLMIAPLHGQALESPSTAAAQDATGRNAVSMRDHDAADAHSGDDHADGYEGGMDNPAEGLVEGRAGGQAETHEGVQEAGHGAGHHADGVPASVYWQAVNFFIFAFLLWFLLRKKVPAYFKERELNFNMALEKAEKAHQEAEAQKREVERRLQALQASADQSIAQAKAEAEELRIKILREAEELSERLKEDAHRTAEIELQRAKTELREEALSQAVTAAAKILSEKIADTDQKRLQSEFVEKIQVVR